MFRWYNTQLRSGFDYVNGNTSTNISQSSFYFKFLQKKEFFNFVNVNYI